jgi:hypothetical protein
MDIEMSDESTEAEAVGGANRAKVSVNLKISDNLGRLNKELFF